MKSNTQNPKNKYPKPPYPKQHQEFPGLEQLMLPKPVFEDSSYEPAGKLENKVALITGADSGIGKAVSIAYAKEGAKVAISYLNEDEDARYINGEIIGVTGGKLLP